MSPEEKRNSKCAIIREAVSGISEDNVSTAVDRLYGTSNHCRVGILKGNKSHLNLSQKQKKRSSTKNSMLMLILKKQKIMLEF